MEINMTQVNGGAASQTAVVAATVTEASSSIVETITKAVTSTFTTIAKFFTEGWNNLSFSAVKEGILSAWNAATLENLKGLAENSLSYVGKTATSVSTYVTSFFSK